MQIERISKKEDLVAIDLLQKEIYHLGAEESLAHHTLVTIFYSGGTIFKATDCLNIIGFSILIFRTDNNNNNQLLHLYRIGVLKSY
jgi:hypothetical protein